MGGGAPVWGDGPGFDPGMPEGAGAGEWEAADGACLEALAAGLSGDTMAMVWLIDGMMEANPHGLRAHKYLLYRAAALSKLGLYGEALETARRALGTGRDPFAAHNAAGNILHDSGDPGGAAEAYGEAARHAGGAKRAGALARRAGALGDLGRHAEALEAAGQAAGLDGSSAEALRAGYRALCSLGRYKDALRLAGAAGHEAIGAEGVVALYGAGKDAEALEAVNALIALGEAGASAWYMKAGLLAGMGKAEPALDALTVAVSLDPSSIARARGDARLEPLRGAERYRRLVG